MAKNQVKRIPKKQENPFEKFANSKKKHEVINRRVKGEDRNVGRARGKAVEVRKNKLLTELQSLKKSNSFADRRFGESNADLSLEEKMFLRFQQERVKKAKKSKFNLDAAETPILTHKGQILGESTFNDNDFGDISDEDDNLGKEVVNKLHFGGGFVPRQQQQQQSSSSLPLSQQIQNSSNFDNQNKSRADVLQEIVMKSKLYKLEKKEAKDAQEDQRELLDKAYSDLVKSASLQFKPTKRDRSEDVEDGDIDEYDKSLRVMAFESRVKPADRTKTKEEIALAEYERLAALEKERLKRMAPDYDPEENLINSALDRSKQQKRKREMNDDCIEDFYQNDNDDSQDEEDEDSQEDEDSEDDEDDDEDDLDIEDENLGSDDDIEEEEDSNDDDDDDQEDNNNNDDDDDEDEEDEEKQPIIKNSKSIVSSNQTNDEMPHSIEAPIDINEFNNLVNTYVVNSDVDFPILVGRILSWNNVNLPGKRVENEKKMTIFFDILVNYFIQIGDSLKKGNRVLQIQNQLEYLGSTIFRLATDLSEVSFLWFHKKIGTLVDNLQTELQYYVEGKQSNCWPSLGHILLFQQIGTMFSITDYNHCIIQSTQLLISQYLTQCPLNTVSHFISGILLVCVLKNYIQSNQKVIPEISIYLNNALNFLIQNKQLNQSSSTSSSTSNKSNIFPLDWSLFNNKTELNQQTFILLLNSVLFLINEVIELNENKEMYLQYIIKLINLYNNENNQLVEVLINYEKITSLYNSYVNKTKFPLKKSLKLRNKKVDTGIKTLNPLYEVDYKIKSNSSNNDKNISSEKLQLKILTKKLKTEQKASMRELRRDSEFLNNEYYESRQKELNKKKEERFSNYLELQKEKEVFNQQVKNNFKNVKGGGSGEIKNKRTKREKRRR